MERRHGPVVIADGDQRARARAAAALTRAGYETVLVTTGAEALETIRSTNVALLVLDIRLPDMTGYEVCHEVRAEYGADMPIFFVTSVRTDAIDRVAGLLLGADDFLAKPYEPDELIARVRRYVARRPLRPNARLPEDSPARELTPREREILALLAEGRRPKEVARELTISQKTVATHIQHLLEKVGVHSRAELVARAYALGIVGSGISAGGPLF